MIITIKSHEPRLMMVTDYQSRRLKRAVYAVNFIFPLARVAQRQSEPQHHPVQTFIDIQRRHQCKAP